MLIFCQNISGIRTNFGVAVIQMAEKNQTDDRGNYIGVSEIEKGRKERRKEDRKGGREGGREEGR